MTSRLMRHSRSFSSVVTDHSWTPLTQTLAPPRQERFPKEQAKFMETEVPRVRKARLDLDQKAAAEVADVNWLTSEANPKNQCPVM